MKDKKRNKLSFRKAENKKMEEMWFFQRWFFTSKYEEQFKRYDKGVKENIEKRIKKRKIIIFFDEINTCYSLDLIKRLICDENFRKKYDIPERFVIICACNPWRVLTDELKKLQFGLSLRNKEKRKLVYTVNPLPYSLLNFVFYFNNLTEETMLKYIQKMIDNIKSKISEKNKQLIMILLIESHLYIIKKGDVSSVTLREIKRFKEIFEFFNEKYFKIYKKEENNDDVIEIKSIALSIYLCYYLRLPSNELREDYINEVIKKNIKDISLIEIAEKESIFITGEVLTNQEGYGKNKALCENIFSEFICILLKMPLIICGKPGSSKSLSIRLLLDVMNGEKSNIEFFKQFPKVVSFYYQCSLTSTSEKIEKIFESAYKKLEKRNYEIISLICMDEMGIADESQNNPLKVLHSQFDENSWKKNDNEKEKIAFVGISNWTLDASKMNRTLYINLGEPNINYIENTAKEMIKGINNNLVSKFENIIKAISQSYLDYMEEQKNREREDFHGFRDFYYLIKYIFTNINENYEQNENNINNNKSNNIFYNIDDYLYFVIQGISRNFGGYEESEKFFQEYFSKIIIKIF